MSKILTPQQVFDRVVAHARTQGRAAMEGNYCRYRAYDGTKSFVGSLIADEHYTPAIELNLCSAPHVVRALQASGIQTGRRMHEFLVTPGAEDVQTPCSASGEMVAKFTRLNTEAVVAEFTEF